MKKLLNYKIKKVENMSLTKQLVYVTLVALAISAIILGIVLPNILKPYYESNIYAHLEQPAKFIKPDTNKMGEDIAFIILTRSGAVYVSDNLNNIIPNLTYDQIVALAGENKGTFEANGSKYYYLWGEKSVTRNLILTDDSLLKQYESKLLGIIFPTMIATISITVILLFTWSQYILNKIKKLERKTKALITGEEVKGNEFIVDDELNELYLTIDQVGNELKAKDEYKNMMFQNLSHELKTPIAVIQSYLEGVSDDVIDKEEALRVISEETQNLSSQVQTILKLNKIDYMKDSKKYLDSKVNITEVIKEVVEKHKLIKPELKYNIKQTQEQILFNGTEEMWKSVFDNLLGNFLRYAKENIEITVEAGKIVLANDGESIEKDMLDKMFLPYVKGKNGQTGLGLSIVKKTVNIFGYDIFARNTDNGVEFKIK